MNIRKRGFRARLFMLGLVMALVFSFAACGGKTDNTGSDGNEDADDVLDQVEGETIVVTDEAGFVTVEITDGAATVFFHPEVWAEHEDETMINENSEAYVPTDEPFPVITYGERVAAAAVGQVEAMGGNHMSEIFTMPSLFLAMDDGTVEWLQLNPFIMYPGDEFHSIITLPFLENIVSLSFEPDGEGVGEHTVYAKDAKGLHYDVRNAHKYADFFEGYWSGTVELGEDEFYIYMIFGRNGLVKMSRSRAYSDDWGSSYSGTFHMHMDEESSLGYLPGILSVDLELDPGQRIADIGDAPLNIKGDFFAESGGFQGWMTLYHADRDPLLEVRGQVADEINFWLDYDSGFQFGDRFILSTDFLSDEELVEYLAMYAGKAGDMLRNQGMKAMVTGESSFIPHEGMCRDVWLGTDQGGSFVKEVMFSVGAYGVIYEFHVPSDNWDMVYMPPYGDDF